MYVNIFLAHASPLTVSAAKVLFAAVARILSPELYVRDFRGRASARRGSVDKASISSEYRCSDRESCKLHKIAASEIDDFYPPEPLSFMLYKYARVHALQLLKNVTVHAYNDPVKRDIAAVVNFCLFCGSTFSERYLVQRRRIMIGMIGLRGEPQTCVSSRTKDDFEK